MSGGSQGENDTGLTSDPHCAECTHGCGESQEVMKMGIFIIGASEGDRREGHGVKEDLKPQAHQSQG